MLLGNRNNRIGIISYCDKVRTYANVNHQHYANKHGYTYIYDIAPTSNGVFKNKVEKILKYLELFEWVFWIDDDAFFMQTDKPLLDFVTPNKKSDVIYCKSPVNQGKWTYLSSGNFFIKNTNRSKQFLRSILETDLSVVQNFWDENKYGLFTNGDQDIMVYLLHADKRFSQPNFHTVLPYECFNSRPFHFNNTKDENYLIHFTGESKNQQVIDFAHKYNLSPALIETNDFNKYKGIYPTE